jgi:hypothetical protein
MTGTGAEGTRSAYPRRMTRTRIPDDILAAAHARSRARALRDWAEADRLRAEIETAGWKVVDRGTDFALSPARPPDVSDARGTRYGSSDSVPSRLDDSPTAQGSIVLVATDWPEDLERALGGIRQHAPEGTQVVIAADGPSPVQEAALEAIALLQPGAPGIGTEVVWTSERLGYAAALNAACRRSVAEVIVLLDTSVELTGDALSPIVAALRDPRVGVAGAWGLTSTDLRQFDESPDADVDALQGYCLAFRRSDYVARGPLDERFRFYRNLDVWWSLVLRDEGEGETPRLARSVLDLPLVRHEHREWATLAGEERDRLSKRNFYRILDRFRGRTDLARGEGDRADGTS